LLVDEEKDFVVIPGHTLFYIGGIFFCGGTLLCTPFVGIGQKLYE
jgi:hypothetical protein